ncbi:MULTISPECIES: hypothetical protein [unclassified Frankia]|uniref:hypothetical protein n=1 Tax=unclassified Frankia TaxID=2632575 RepID=UPI001EF549D9|nr:MULTISPECIES: hypothetical protein [unclassified Frankia]
MSYGPELRALALYFLLRRHLPVVPPAASTASPRYTPYTSRSAALPGCHHPPSSPDGHPPDPAPAPPARPTATPTNRHVRMENELLRTQEASSARHRRHHLLNQESDPHSTPSLPDDRRPATLGTRRPHTANTIMDA